MRSGVVLLGTVLAALLTPLAYASPPDPSWIMGIYDDADYDDVVWFITATNGVAQTVGLGTAHSLPVAGRVSALETCRAPASPAFSSHSRAPPAS